MITSTLSYIQTRRKGDMAIESVMRIIIAVAIIFFVISLLIMVTGNGEAAFSNLGLDILSDKS